MGHKIMGRNSCGLRTQIIPFHPFYSHFFPENVLFISKNNYLCHRNSFRRNAFIHMNERECFKFTKEERVTGDKRIETLFTEGRSFMAYPFRVVYLETVHSPATPLSILISIPKKRLKSAVDRNRMKRLVREAYRLNKNLIEDALLLKEGHIDVAFIYVKDELSDFATVEQGMQKALRALMYYIGNVKC